MFNNLIRRYTNTKLERDIEANIRRLRLGLTQQERNDQMRRRHAGNALLWVFILLAVVNVVFLLLNYPK